MPKLYIRKTRKTSVEVLARAVWAYRNSNSSQEMIAAEYGLPRSTLAKYLKPNQELPKRLTQGRDKVFTDQEELAMVKFAIDMANKGCPMNREAFAKFVFLIAKARGKEKRLQSSTNGFKKDYAGGQFLNSFLVRHPTLRFQFATSTSASKACRPEAKGKPGDFSMEDLERAIAENGFQPDEIDKSMEIPKTDSESDMSKECSSALNS